MCFMRTGERGTVMALAGDRVASKPVGFPGTARTSRWKRLLCLVGIVGARALVLQCLDRLPTSFLPSAASWGVAPAPLAQSRAPRRGRTALAAEGPGKYRALARIRVREEADTEAAAQDRIIERDEVVDVNEVVASNAPSGLNYLRLSDGGWIFDIGIAGKWVGKPIVESVDEASKEAASADDAADPSPVAEAAPAPAPEEEKEEEEAQVEEAEAEASEPLEPTVALASVKVETLRWPPGMMLGVGFEAVQLEVKGKVLNFLLSSGFPKNAITPAGRGLLGDALPSAEFAGGSKGGWLSAMAKEAANVDLEDVKFAGTGVSLGDISGCEELEVFQAQIADQLGMTLHGILGSPFFERFDLDLERYQGRLNFFQPGEAGAGGFYSTVRHLPGLELPSGLLGIALTGPASYRDVEEESSDADEMVSFIGVVDTGAAHSIVNWEAAKLLGFSGPDDTRLDALPKVVCPGADGQMEEMPVIMAKFSMCEVPAGVRPTMFGVSKEQFESEGGDGWYLKLPKLDGTCLQLGAVNLAIGEALALSALDDSKIGKFKGAAAIIGQDLLFQAQRVVLNYRDKQIWLEPGAVQDQPPM